MVEKRLLLFVCFVFGLISQNNAQFNNIFGQLFANIQFPNTNNQNLAQSVFQPVQENSGSNTLLNSIFNFAIVTPSTTAATTTGTTTASTITTTNSATTITISSNAAIINFQQSLLQSIEAIFSSIFNFGTITSPTIVTTGTTTTVNNPTTKAASTTLTTTSTTTSTVTSTTTSTTTTTTSTTTTSTTTTTTSTTTTSTTTTTTSTTTTSTTTTTTSTTTTSTTTTTTSTTSTTTTTTQVFAGLNETCGMIQCGRYLACVNNICKGDNGYSPCVENGDCNQPFYCVGSVCQYD